MFPGTGRTHRLLRETVQGNPHTLAQVCRGERHVGLRIKSQWSNLLTSKSLSRVQLSATPIGCSPPGSSVHGDSPGKILYCLSLHGSPQGQRSTSLRLQSELTGPARCSQGAPPTRCKARNKQSTNSGCQPSSIPHGRVNSNIQPREDPLLTPCHSDLEASGDRAGGPCRVPTAGLGPVPNPAGGPSLSSAHALPPTPGRPWSGKTEAHPPGNL